MRIILALLVTSVLAAMALQPQATPAPLPRLAVSSNHRYMQAGEAPFFWLGDTAWLLFQKLDRAETEKYLDDRRSKGFNVIQVMVVRSERDTNAYGSAAFIDGQAARPNVTPGSDPAKRGEYDYWDHVDWVIDAAAARGIYVGMVCAWGSVARSGALNADNAAEYARFLAQRYSSRTNIVWLLGGDTRGDQNADVWRRMGQTIRKLDPAHLITFHPFGRTQSSTWFHNEPWLDFNMFQSGHRRYDQDTTPGAKGEDNWRYVVEDLAKQPPKPTLDGEPSYENIPQGLHDPKEPYWTADQIRRYAYWSVFAGACGHTYGNNAVMQMHKPDSGKGSYGVRDFWYDAINAPGASQMQHLKRLMLSRPFFERVPDQRLVAGTNGTRHEYVVATRGGRYAMLYTWTGGPFHVQMGVIDGEKAIAQWFNPRTGAMTGAGTFPNRGVREFTPPGPSQPGSDWVLVLDDAAARTSQ